MADLFFADISNWNSAADLAAYRAPYSVLGNEISWGTSITVPPGRVAAIRALKFDLVWHYAGLRADESLAAQVSAFVQGLGGSLEDNEAVVIDWESTPPNVPIPSVAQREQFHAMLATALDIPTRRVGTYGAASSLEGPGAEPPVGAVIVASYETEEPAVAHTAWQFTDGTYVSPPYSPIDFPGIGKCDASVFHGTVAELQAAFGLELVSDPPYHHSLLLMGGTR